MKELENKIVTAIHVNQDQSLIKFSHPNDESTIYCTEADCCSETWFADIIFSFSYYWNNKVYPFTVESANDIEMPLWVSKVAEKDGRTRQEFDQVYGYSFHTDKGAVEIIYRNSSNGYYGGSCVLLELDSRWANDVLEEVEWTAITEDWSA